VCVYSQAQTDWRSPKSFSFTPEGAATLKHSQIPTPTAQIDLLAEHLSPKEKDNHVMYGEISKDYFNSIPVFFQQPALAHQEQNKVKYTNISLTIHFIQDTTLR